MSNYDLVSEFNRDVRGTQFPERAQALTGGLKADRIKFMQEELSEFSEAEDLCDQVDALVDLHYFLLGTLYEMGVKEDQYDECFLRVHTANMAKKAGKKAGRNTSTVDAAKPEGWQEPTFKDIFEKGI